MKTCGIFAFLVLAFLSGDSPAGSWGLSGCGPVGPVVASPVRGLPTPFQYGAGGLCSPLCTCGCNQSGACPCKGKPAPAKPVTTPSKTEAPKKQDPSIQGTVQNFGVDFSQLDADGGYKINGQPVTRQQAWEAIESGTLKDDSGKLRLTVIGPETERQQVLKDLANHPSLGALKDAVLTKDYPPDHWAVSRVGFKTDGHPTIYLQAADGKVLHRQDDYQGGPGKLAQALRKADPNYKPDMDPDKRKPVAPAAFDWSTIPNWAWIAAGVLAMLFFISPKIEEPR